LPQKRRLRGTARSAQSEALRRVLQNSLLRHARVLSYRRKRNHGVAKAILDNRGNTPRLFGNTLVFLALDKVRLQDLDEAIRRFLAWRSILDEREGLNLDPFQVRQAETQLASCAYVTNGMMAFQASEAEYRAFGYEPDYDNLAVRSIFIDTSAHWSSASWSFSVAILVAEAISNSA
jgi:hypothetical protein